MDIRIMMYACNLAGQVNSLTTDIQAFNPSSRCGVTMFASYSSKEEKKWQVENLEHARAMLASYGVRCTKIRPNDSESCLVNINWNGNKNRKVSDKFWYCLCRDFIENHSGQVAADFQSKTYAEQEKMIGDWLEETGACDI